jgi:hypothetical protein
MDRVDQFLTWILYSPPRTERSSEYGDHWQASATRRIRHENKLVFLVLFLFKAGQWKQMISRIEYGKTIHEQKPCEDTQPDLHKHEQNGENACSSSQSPDFHCPVIGIY